MFIDSNLLSSIFALSGLTQAAPVNELQPHFQIKYTIDQHRFQVQVNLSFLASNRWYIARIVQIWSTPVGYEELAGALSQSETVKYFNNNNNNNNNTRIYIAPFP